MDLTVPDFDRIMKQDGSLEHYKKAIDCLMEHFNLDEQMLNTPTLLSKCMEASEWCDKEIIHILILFRYGRSEEVKKWYDKVINDYQQ